MLKMLISISLNNTISNDFCLPNHDDGEVENVPRISEVGRGMCDEAKSNDPHAALGGEDDSEDDLNLLEEVIGGIAVAIGEGSEHG